MPVVEPVFNASTLLEITLTGAVSRGQGHDPTVNASDNSSDSDSDAFYPLLKQSPYMILLYSLAYGLVFVSALVGNVMVMVVVGRNPALHSVTNYFLVNLAVADILVALFCVPSTSSSICFQYLIIS
ncbi:hypothetical protein C0Q70_01272 [Pomacea canaliculata]|uniref:G-protein coupled receptors family 1 profile domain-containing protein n=1 Tax=Pomacea canaliculata TaxID=400727 RepID=A0A2T7PZ10_POMCA|nr:hypothetical protein C0Q70_01272 [Pomacea canaliculata]